MPGPPPKPLSQISPTSVEHNKGRLEDRLKKLTTTTVGKLGNPSRWMTKDQQRIWKQLVKAAPGMLGERQTANGDHLCPQAEARKPEH